MSTAATDTSPRRLLALTVAVAAAAGAVGVLGAVTGHDDVAEPADVRITVSDFAFEPARLDVEAGNFNLFIDNADATLHDFTIDGIVSVDVPGKRSRRAKVALLDPGEYPFYCTLHPSMTGTVTTR